MSFLPEGYKPEPVQDMSGEFEVMKGKAVAKIERVERDQGAWPSGDAKDQVSVMYRLTACVSGNCHANRVVFKKYGMLDGVTQDGREFKGADARARLANDLCTAGYDVDLSSEDAFYASLTGSIGTEANLVLGEYNGKQSVKVVEKFSEQKKSGGVETKAEEEVPF